MLCNERSMSFSSLKAGTIIEIFTLTVCTLDHKEVDYIANLSNTDACWLMRSSGQSGVVRSSDLLSQLPFCAATERDAVLVPRPRKNGFYGIRTASMTWITPLLASMSVLMTFAPPTVTLPASTLMASSLPFKVLALVVVRSAAINLPGRTWYVSTATSFSLFSGLSRFSTVPAGSLAKASSVGAKTVKGPLPFKVSTSPAAFTAATRVLNCPAAAATPTMVFCSAAETVFMGTNTSAAKAAAMRVIFFMSYGFDFCVGCGGDKCLLMSINAGASPLGADYSLLNSRYLRIRVVPPDVYTWVGAFDPHLVRKCLACSPIAVFCSGVRRLLDCALP